MEREREKIRNRNAVYSVPFEIWRAKRHTIQARQMVPFLEQQSINSICSVLSVYFKTILCLI